MPIMVLKFNLSGKTVLTLTQYRDIAPEAVEDATIINLIQKSAGNHSAISAAIENMWHGE